MSKKRMAVVFALVLSTGALSELSAGVALADMAVANYLEETPHVGIAYGNTPEKARSAALKACAKSDAGIAKDCAVYADFSLGPPGFKNRTCLSAAQGYNGDFGYGIGPTKSTAAAAAVNSCRIGAVAPRYCRQRGAIVCQDSLGRRVQ